MDQTMQQGAIMNEPNLIDGKNKEVDGFGNAD